MGASTSKAIGGQILPLLPTGSMVLKSLLCSLGLSSPISKWGHNGTSCRLEGLPCGGVNPVSSPAVPGLWNAACSHQHPTRCQLGPRHTERTWILPLGQSWTHSRTWESHDECGAPPLQVHLQRHQVPSELLSSILLRSPCCKISMPLSGQGSFHSVLWVHKYPSHLLLHTYLRSTLFTLLSDPHLARRFPPQLHNCLPSAPQSQPVPSWERTDFNSSLPCLKYFILGIKYKLSTVHKAVHKALPTSSAPRVIC